MHNGQQHALEHSFESSNKETFQVNIHMYYDPKALVYKHDYKSKFVLRSHRCVCNNAVDLVLDVWSCPSLKKPQNYLIMSHVHCTQQRRPAGLRRVERIRDKTDRTHCTHRQGQGGLKLSLFFCFSHCLAYLGWLPSVAENQLPHNDHGLMLPLMQSSNSAKHRTHNSTKQ